MTEYNLKQYAHIGDAVWELFIREFVIQKFSVQKTIHTETVKYVNADFQSSLIELLEPYLTDDEKELLKRGRNLSLTISKKHNPQTHRLATAFEVLIGYFYLNNKPRLNQIFEIINEKAL